MADVNSITTKWRMILTHLMDWTSSRIVQYLQPGTPQNLPAEYLCVSCMPWSYAYVMEDSVLYSVYTCTVLVAWYSILYMPRSQYLHVHFFIICAVFALELESLNTNTATILVPVCVWTQQKYILTHCPVKIMAHSPRHMHTHVHI